MICNICLSEKVRGEVGRLKLCDECMDKIREYWDETEIKRY